MQSGDDLEALSHAAQRLVELYLSRAGTEWDERDVVEELRRCACAPTRGTSGPCRIDLRHLQPAARYGGQGVAFGELHRPCREFCSEVGASCDVRI
jgi:hypothetical protein